MKRKWKLFKFGAARGGFLPKMCACLHSTSEEEHAHITQGQIRVSRWLLVFFLVQPKKKKKKKERKKKGLYPPTQKKTYNTELIYNLDGAFRDRRVK